LPPAKVVGEPDQVIVVLYWPLELVELTGVAPAEGAVTPAIAPVVMTLLFVVIELEADEADEVAVPL
jgi:hypothetical protein